MTNPLHVGDVGPISNHEGCGFHVGGLFLKTENRIYLVGSHQRWPR